MKKIMNFFTLLKNKNREEKSYFTIISFFIVTAAIPTSLVTYSILTGMSFIELSDNIIKSLIIINGIFIILLLALLVGQFWQIYKNQTQKKHYAPKLQKRMLLILTLTTIIPTAMVAIFAYNTMQRSLDSWFAEKTKKHISNAEQIAESYIKEHSNNIRIEAIAMARDLNSEYFSMLSNPVRFNQFIRTQAILRSLSAAYVFNIHDNTISHYTINNKISFQLPEQSALLKANKGQVVITQPYNNNQVQAMIQLAGFGPGYYLLVYRYLDGNVLEHLRQTRQNVLEYQFLESKRDQTEFAFAIVFITMSLVLLLSALWAAIWISKWLAKPLLRLTDAADIVASGKLDYKLEIDEKEGEITELAHSFNYMTDKIEQQHKMLVKTNAKLDDRNRFTEAVLAGIATGVISVGKGGLINLVNTAAEKILNKKKQNILLKPVTEVIPEIKNVFENIRKKNAEEHIVKQQMKFNRFGEKIIVDIRIAMQTKGRQIKEAIITLDDISQLVLAQRSAAWAEIAKRIAHEIKNPLTPIQLSTERLKRKYVDKINQNEREVFNQCTDTIIRQVSDIGKMVEEFSEFSYMPAAKIEKNDVTDIVKTTVELERMRNSQISYHIDIPKQKILANCDRRLISQALVNILKNAIEAIEALQQKQKYGKINILLKIENKLVKIQVRDNGIGLPKNNLTQITEPYVTHRTSGTGLGLAIVKRIMEQHKGYINFENNLQTRKKYAGATATLKWPLDVKNYHKNEKELLVIQ